MMKRRSWITREAVARQKHAWGLGQNPIDPPQGKDLVPIVSQPYDPSFDAERCEFDPGYQDIAMGFNRHISSDDVKMVAKIVVRHPEDSSLILYGMRRDTGAWSLPGGHLEPGESPMGAMFREFKEECGVDLVSAEYVACVQVLDSPVVVHVFEGSGPESTWAGIDSSQDPDSEFVCFQYINPLDCDFPMHIPGDKDAVLHYLRTARREGIYGNSLADLTTEKEASSSSSRFVVHPPRRHGEKALTRPGGTYQPMAPDKALFPRTDEAQWMSYQNPNQFEDPDLKLGAVQPYDSGGMSPADPMNESLGDVHIQQHGMQELVAATSVQLGSEEGVVVRPDGIMQSVDPACSVENSKGTTVEDENIRGDWDMERYRDYSIRTPI